ncbi:MAG: hypothetical protein ACRD5E_09020 [Nitrososphaeraceae archaeon]
MTTTETIIESASIISNPTNTNTNTNDNGLYLVYYALDDSLNLNGWRVSPNSLERNIRSFVGKPLVIKSKDLFNPNDRDQAGNFVHPILKNASLTENLNYQEQFAVGRINSVTLNPNRGWRFDVEITDPKLKEAFTSKQLNRYSYGYKYPRYVSPQIATFPDRFPVESAAGVENWHGLHLALVDVPAYGFYKANVAGECYGAEARCQAELKSASTMSQKSAVTTTNNKTQAMINKLYNERAAFYLSVYAPELKVDPCREREEVGKLTNLLESDTLSSDKEVIDYLGYVQTKVSNDKDLVNRYKRQLNHIKYTAAAATGAAAGAGAGDTQ